MNINLLKSKMVLHGDGSKELAEALNITRPCMSLKLNERTDFKQYEIDIIIKRYDLTGDEIKEIFFS